MSQQVYLLFDVYLCVPMTKYDFAKKENKTENEKHTKRSVLKRIILLGITLAITPTISTYVLSPRIPVEFLSYVQVAQFALVGYFVMEIISNSAFSLVTASRLSNQTAKPVRGLIRILGSIIIAAII